MAEQSTSNPGNGVPPVVTGDFSPEQLTSMAQHEVDRGRLTRAEADSMLKADGVAALPAPLSPEAAEIDRQFPPARAQDYEFPLYGAPGQGLTPEQTAFDNKARGWLAEARFPANIGSSLAKEITREAARSEKFSEADRALSQKSTMLTLERMWGADTKKRVGMARQLVRELDKKSPGLVDMLERTNAGNSPLVIQLLAAQAERLLMRQGGK